MGLGQVLGLLPFLAVWVVAGVLALARWDRHPTASILVLVAAVISVMSRVASLVVPMAMSRGGMDMSSMSWVFTAIGMVGTVAFACLIAAVFVDRDGKNGPPTLPR